MPDAVLFTGSTPRRFRSLRRNLTLLLAAMPLLALGTCSAIGVRSAINGFFNAVTPELDARLETELQVRDSASAP